MLWLFPCCDWLFKSLRLVLYLLLLGANQNTEIAGDFKLDIISVTVLGKELLMCKQCGQKDVALKANEIESHLKQTQNGEWLGIIFNTFKVSGAGKKDF